MRRAKASRSRKKQGSPSAPHRTTCKGAMGRMSSQQPLFPRAPGPLNAASLTALLRLPPLRSHTQASQDQASTRTSYHDMLAFEQSYGLGHLNISRHVPGLWKDAVSHQEAEARRAGQQDALPTITSWLFPLHVTTSPHSPQPSPLLPSAPDCRWQLLG